MTKLHAHSNVYDTALAVLEAWGYRVNVEEDLHENVEWHAICGAFEFSGGSPIELLGVAAIHRHIGPEQARAYWWTLEPNRDVAELKREAESILLPAKEFLQKPDAYELVKTALVESAGDLDKAVIQLGIRRSLLEMILGEPAFCELEDFVG